MTNLRKYYYYNNGSIAIDTTNNFIQVSTIHNESVETFWFKSENETIKNLYDPKNETLKALINSLSDSGQIFDYDKKQIKGKTRSAYQIKYSLYSDANQKYICLTSFINVLNFKKEIEDRGEIISIFKKTGDHSEPITIN